MPSSTLNVNSATLESRATLAEPRRAGLGVRGERKDRAEPPEQCDHERVLLE